nr:MAG TPA: nucelotide kinase [Caudoviricetes sp.]
MSSDNVNHPPHYNAGGIECIDALEAATSGLQGIEAFCTANAIKYLWRWKLKNGAEDLQKAVWYINRLIQRQAELARKVPQKPKPTPKRRKKR